MLLPVHMCSHTWRLLTSVCMCAHTCVHAFTCVCMFSCVCSHVCMCSPVRTDMHVPVLSHAGMRLNSVFFQPFIYMLPCTCVYPGVCSHAFTHSPLCTCAYPHVHGLTHKHPPVFLCQRACAYTPTHVHAPTDARPCLLTRACPHTPALMHPRVCMRTRPPPCACAHTGVLVPSSGRCCPCTAAPPALPGVVGLPGVGRGPALPWHGDGVPGPTPWCPAGTQRPWGRHLASKGTVAVPTRTTLPCWGEPGHPRPVQQQQHHTTRWTRQPPLGHSLPGATANVPAAMLWL